MFRWFLATLALTVTVTCASAAFTVTVIPSVGPAPSSPSFLSYATNSIPGIRNGGVSIGTPGGSNSYIPAGTAQPGGAINYLIPPPGSGVTHMWNGQPNAPGYAGELGNWIYFGLALRSTVPGQTFTA